ncbi:hypothetical protein Pla163_01040 [Planctomycetes bacterium Pla163]|uniref:EF-hand domain-containing protein n=1 Tax=Rohdeia mirabilis TaxID=2528008 RepID=A0A518CUW9_9BACT|nr:hypothetical protein Pla163_01040 [Planctomycetes bacterium Pla163]
MASLVVSGLVTAAAASWTWSVAAADEVSATAMDPTLDSDHDGVVDVFELIMGTNLASADTDQDGCGDAEEIARLSDPRDQYSLPESDDTHLGQYAFVADDTFHLVTLTYLPYAIVDWHGFDLRLGFKNTAGQVELIPQVYQQFATVAFIPGAVTNSLIVKLEIKVPASLFENIGPFAFFATLSTQPGTAPKTAAATNIEQVAGVFAAVEKSTTSVVAPRNYWSQNGSGPSLSIRPIVVSDEVPVAFTIGQICLQSTTEVGYSNGIVELLIDSSSCEPADAYCSPNCPFEAGNTKELADPLALIGG